MNTKYISALKRIARVVGTVQSIYKRAKLLIVWYRAGWVSARTAVAFLVRGPKGKV